MEVVPWQAPRPATGLLSQTATEIMGANRPASRARLGTPEVKSAATTLGSGFPFAGSAELAARSTTPLSPVKKRQQLPNELEHLAATAGSPKSPGPDTRFGLTHSLSPCTVRENSRRELHVRELTNALSAGSPDAPGKPKRRFGNSTSQLSALNPEDLGAQTWSPENFQSEVKALEDNMTTYHKSLNMEHMTALRDGETPAQARKRQEEERRRAADERRLRKMENEARNPKKKVALRIQSTREYGAQGKSKREIPVRTVHLGGGKEGQAKTVDLVDIVGLKQGMIHIDSRPSVAHMVDEIRVKEVAARHAKAATDKALPKSRSAPNLLGGGESPSRHARHDVPVVVKLFERSWEERRMAGAIKKESDHVQKLVHMLSEMRNPVPDLPFTMESMQKNANLFKTLSQQGVSPIPTSPQALASTAEGAAAVPSLADSVMQSAAASLPTGMKSLADLSKGKIQKRHEKEAHAKGKLMALNAMCKTGEPTAADLARHCRWVKLRCLVVFLGFAARARTKAHKSEIMKVVLKAAGEWARLKGFVHKFRSSMELVQFHARGFIKLKRQRCEAMEKEWKRFEDHHLSTFFFNYAKRMLEEQKAAAKNSRLPGAKASPQQLALEKQLEAGLKDGSLKVEWRKWRIPVETMRVMISRYYMQTLRNRVRTSASLHAVIAGVLAQQKEMAIFLSSFTGGEVVKKVSLIEVGSIEIPEAQEQVTPPAFYAISEDQCLQMIALCAQRLAVAGTPEEIDLYRQHPSLQEVSFNPMYRPALEGLEGVSLSATSGEALSKQDIEKATFRMDRAISKVAGKPTKKGRPDAVSTRSESRRMSRPLPDVDEEDPGSPKTPTIQAFTAAQHALKPKLPTSIEEVMGNFTPRLREITDDQAADYRMCPPDFLEAAKTPRSGSKRQPSKA